MRIGIKTVAKSNIIGLWHTGPLTFTLPLYKLSLKVFGNKTVLSSSGEHQKQQLQREPAPRHHLLRRFVLPSEANELFCPNPNEWQEGRAERGGLWVEQHTSWTRGDWRLAADSREGAGDWPVKGPVWIGEACLKVSVSDSVFELKGDKQKVNRDAVLIWSQLCGGFFKIFVFITKIWNVYFWGHAI